MKKLVFLVIMVLSVLGLLAEIPVRTKLLPQAMIVYGERLPELSIFTTLLDLQIDGGMYSELTLGDTVLVLLRTVPETGYNDFVFQKIEKPVSVMELDLMPGEFSERVAVICSEHFFNLLKVEFKKDNLIPEVIVLELDYYAILLDSAGFEDFFK